MKNDKLKNLLFPLVSSITLGLAFPPLPLGFLAWVALVPLLLCLENADWKSALRRGLLFGIVYNLVSLYYIAFNSGTTPIIATSAYLGMALIVSLYSLLFALPIAFIMRRWQCWGVLAVPFLWMTVEYIRSLGEIAFPWNITPLTQANYLYPVQIVSVTGIWGLSFWVAGINALTYIVVKKGRRWFIAPIVWCGIPFVWGFLMLKGAPTADSTLDVALVQGNVDPAGKWANGLIYNLNLYDDLTSDIRASDLVVWPEAAVPTYLESSVRARRTIKHIAQQISAPVFTGALAQDISEEGIEHHYNSAFLIKPDTIKIERYDKVHLVPFGERVPFQGMFPALGNLNLGQAEFTPGKEYRIFHLDSADFAGLICFESIFPQLVRKFVIGGADFLVNITNDGWYGKTAEPYQQALLTRFRAIENSRSIIRCANTGVSYLMDGRGRFIEKSEMETEAILQGKIPLYNNETFYTKYGDVFALTIVSITIILMLFIGKQCI